MALLTSYSYVRLTLALPSRGGTVAYVNAAFGTGLSSGSLNILLRVSYVVMLALYAAAVGSYGASLLEPVGADVAKHVLLTSAVVAITVLNVLSADLIGKTEDFIVGLQLLVLLVFVGVGFGRVDAAALELGYRVWRGGGIVVDPWAEDRPRSSSRT